MNRRGFLTFWRAAPAALPVLLSEALTGDGRISLDGSALYLGGKKIIQQNPDGSTTIGEAQNLHLMPPTDRNALLTYDPTK